uniref:Beta-1,4-N-acetylgalactosaminyltransferase n=1 Tax=Plectus sambesii TaxID=2011161 RepID=A0A914WD67_9BILA
SPRRTDKLPAERNDTAEMERDDRLNWEFGDENVLAARQLMMPVNASSVTTVRPPPPLETTSTSETLPLCPDLPDIKELEGPMQQAVLLIQNIKETEVLRHHTYLKPGGHWKPSHCVARHKVAVIVPFRDRQSHLSRLLDFLVPLLKRQMLDFRFIVTEQYGNDLFNKGRIMNAAFEVAQRLGVNCVIFHDVDMFPQNDRNPYGCPDSPRHIGAFVSNLGYQLWYDYIVGGALAIRMEHYIAVNGYSNMYWAWGGEDDDMGKRIFALNFTIERPHPIEGRFTMLKHVKRKRTAPKLIYKLLDSAGTRWPYDGLNETGLWKIVKITRRPLYYHMYVDVGQPPEAWRIDGDLPETTVAAKAAAPAAAPIV